MIVLIHTVASTALAQETVLYNFVGTTGNFPDAGVILDHNGNPYGTTPIGGNLGICGGNGCGAVFEIVHNPDSTWSERNVYAFTGGPADGASPYSQLVFDSYGHIFGMTYYGGSGSCAIGQFPGCGTVFELTHTATGWTEQVLYSFQGGIDGAYPQASLILDARGNLYGTTTVGGGSTACVLSGTPYGCGTVFELSPNGDGSWSENVLYRFQSSPDGAEPGGGLVLDGQGSLYGTTGGGGLNCQQYLKGDDCGTVFKLRQTSPGNWVKSTLYRFKGGTDGFVPTGNLTLDSSGNLYGTTYFGGITSPPFGNGTVYELSPAAGNTWTENVLYRFTGFLDGGYPTGGVVFDTHGNLFALPNGGGSNGQDAGGGTVDELTPGASGWTETTLFAFPGGTQGELPYGGLAIDANGNLYGTAPYGGASSGHCSQGCGIVFEVTP
jgi:uncharacterized repeat protein (TIGR03803 family)